LHIDSLDRQRHCRYAIIVVVIFLCMPVATISQNAVPFDRHHIILCFDANGNGGKIDLLSKAGEKKFAIALHAVFDRLRQPESSQVTSAIFDPSRQDLATILFYVPDVRNLRSIRDFNFARDFVFLSSNENTIAQEKLSEIDDFIQTYKNILSRHKRNDGLNLYQEAAAASVLFLAQSQYADRLKPVDKIYVINFYSENINLDSARNTLESYIRSAWEDTVNSSGAAAKRDSLVQQLAAIKNRERAIEHKIIKHVNGLKFHYVIAEYNPLPLADLHLLKESCQNLKLEQTGSGNYRAIVDLADCLFDPLLSTLQPEYWRLQLIDATNNKVVAQNWGRFDRSFVAETSNLSLQLVNSKNLLGRLQVATYVTAPLALKSRFKEVIDLKVSRAAPEFSLSDLIKANWNWIELFVWLVISLILAYIVRSVRKIKGSLSQLPQQLLQDFEASLMKMMQGNKLRSDWPASDTSSRTSPQLVNQTAETTPPTEGFRERDRPPAPAVQSNTEQFDAQQAYERTVQRYLTSVEFMERYKNDARRVSIELEQGFGSARFGGLKEIPYGDFLLISSSSNWFLYPYFGVLSPAQENSAKACFECQPGLFAVTRNLHDLTITPAILEKHAGRWQLKKKGNLAVN